MKFSVISNIFEHNLGKQYMCDEYAEMQEVIDMPSFPQKGCCRMVGDVMVVKLSDNMFLRKNQDAESNKKD